MPTIVVPIHAEQEEYNEALATTLAEKADRIRAAKEEDPHAPALEDIPAKHLVAYYSADCPACGQRLTAAENSSNARGREVYCVDCALWAKADLVTMV